jgi:predicted permease
MLEPIARDLRFAARGLRRSPAFTGTAVATLALGIGATTAVFSVVYGIVLRPLPFPNADRLVRVVQLLPERPGGSPAIRAGLTPDQITEWRATSRTLGEIGYYSSHAAVLSDASAPVRLVGAQVSVSLFRALGVRPLLGRLFANEDEQPGNEDVVVLGHQIWRTRLGSSEAVIGQTLSLNDRITRVIGVMPEGFGFPSIASAMSVGASGEIANAPEFWMPLMARPRPAGPATGGMTLVQTYALLRPGVTVEQATAEANTLMPARVTTRYPVEVVNARVEEAREVRPTLLVFQAAVLFVLFIACVNVVNLLLARTASRRHELAIRRALGASPAEIVRYGVAEGVIVGAAGGALGSLFAWQIVASFRALPPFLLPRMADVRVDGVVLALAIALSIGAGLLVGVAAALRSLRDEAGAGSMTWHSRTVSAGRAQRPSRALLAAEVAAGLVLLAGAGLLLNSFARLTSVDRGFDPEGVFTFRVSLPASYQPTAWRAFHDAFAETLRQLPGVAAIGASDYLPGRGSIGFKTIVDDQSHAGSVAFTLLAPGVFETLRIPLRGRDFNARDRLAQPAVAIVNETFARKFFPGPDPLGRRIGFQNWPSLEIVGVAGDTRMADVTDTLYPAIYLPQFGSYAAALYVVRVTGRRDVSGEIRAAAARIDTNAVLFNATTMETLLARTVASPKLYSATAGGFAIVAVALAALGLYGVLAYSIGTRTREFGIRITLGATPRSLVGGVMRDAAWAVLPGLAAGLAGALYLSRYLESLLFGIQPRDPGTFAGVALLFLLIAALACYMPARRATRVDPVVALRAE